MRAESCSDRFEAAQSDRTGIVSLPGRKNEFENWLRQKDASGSKVLVCEEADLIEWLKL
jgi:hypothetical protein